MYKIHFILVGILILGGCSLVGDNDPEKSALEQNRRLWKAQDLSTYTYALSRHCFCGYYGAYTVVVDRDTIQTITSVVTSEAIPAEEYQYFETIDDLFHIVEKALEEADVLRVEYHPRFGYPTEIDIDYYKEAVDDEITYQASLYERLEQ